MRVKPAEGRMVRDPTTMAFVPDTGREVPETFFWRRRLRDGDVVLVDAPDATAQAQEPQAVREA